MKRKLSSSLDEKKSISVNGWVMSELINRCKIIRNTIYDANIGKAWPFLFSQAANEWQLIHNAEIKHAVLPYAYFVLGAHLKISNLILKARMKKSTSQGRIFVAIMQLKDKDVTLIIKIDKLLHKHKNLWLEKGLCSYMTIARHIHIVISNAYMDALCAVLLSYLVERCKSPHFAICYGVHVSNIKLRLDNDGWPGQVIWMEYLSKSLFDILQLESDIKIWWSCIAQTILALRTAHLNYQFIHNDLHCMNIRVRSVSRTASLYYRVDKNVYIKVPTFGSIVVLIDFGRSRICPSGAFLSTISVMLYKLTCLSGDIKDSLISSDFTSDGPCRYLDPQNENIDVVRLLLSLYDLVKNISPANDRDIMDQFFKRTCSSKDGDNLIRLMSNCRESNLDYILDDLPRKVCYNANWSSLKPIIVNMYQCIDLDPSGYEIYDV